MKKRNKIMLYRLVIAMLLFAVGLIGNKIPFLSIILFFGAYIVSGYDVLWNAARNIFHGHLFDENFLMAIATIGAWALREYPEAVAVMVFYQIGELFQSIAVGKSRKSIADLMNICPETAVVLRDGQEQRISPDEVMVGEIFLVRAGDKIPLDGIVTMGESEINTAALTGESLPRGVAPGDSVVSGTINMSGMLQVEATRSFSESTVSKILELVENAAEGKAKTERFITRFSRWYTPMVVVGALLLALIPPLFWGDFYRWIHRSLIFLVVSCPCALVISVPLSFFGGIGCASKKGILIKGANYLESLGKATTFIFDKTGTLTQGNFAVSSIESCSMEQEKLLEYAALAESNSNHPIAQSVVAAYGKPLDRSRVETVREYPGKGISALIDQHHVVVGNKKMMEMSEIIIPNKNHFETALFVAFDGKYSGCIKITDAMKEGAQSAISGLKKNGISKVVMLTGDLMQVAATIGEQIGIDIIESELLPHQKVEHLEQYLCCKKRGETIVFVGDGVNDAPALTRADVGIAMGALGSDAAIEAADVVLMDDDLRKIPLAIRLAKRTMSIVWQNIIFAIGIKMLVMILGAFGWAGIWLAIFADVGVMILAILNAMRALKF